MNDMSITFDTHLEVERLIKGGLDKTAAEAVVQLAARAAKSPDVAGLATKEGLDGLDKKMNLLATFVLAAAGINLAGFLGIAAILVNIARG